MNLFTIMICRRRLFNDPYRDGGRREHYFVDDGTAEWVPVGVPSQPIVFEETVEWHLRSRQIPTS